MTMALQSQQPMVAQALAPARLYVWGLSHHALALEEREALALPPEARTQLEAWLAAHTWRKEHLVLATCNRLEIYCVTREADFAEAVTTQLAEALAYPVERLRAQSYHRTGEEAVRHLFRVCAGVDSQIVGEPEILGQVKASYEKAKASGQLGPWLHRVFQKAFQAAKWVRTHTRIGQGHTSIGQVTVELAERICGDLRAARILVLGAGETAELTLHALWQRQAKHITVANRSPVAAEALTQAVGGRVVDFSIWQEVLSEQDIFIASTAAPDVLLSVEATTQAMRYRRGRPLCLIDLAMPRNIDAATSSLPNVFYYNLDNLAAVANENLRERASEVARCEDILAERSTRLWAGWWPQVLRYFREA